ncbi:MAG: hypothetical protein RL030_2787 [Pseudomonadota bacterium]|jgi:hypothetical protein
MIPPDNCLNNGKAFSALLSDVAADPAVMTEVDRLAALDRCIAALIMLADADLRELYLDLASVTLRLGKKLAKSRLANALRLHCSWLEAQTAAAVDRERATTPAIAPLERLTQAIAAAVPGFAFLLAAIAPMPDALDPVGKLKAADQVIAAVAPMPDHDLRNLYLDEAAARLDLKPRDLRQRFASAQSAPSAPAGQQVGGQELDRGFHRAVIGALGRYLDGLGITPDAVSGWLDADGRPANVKHRELVNNFFFSHASFFESLPRERIDITLSAMTATRRQVRRNAILATVTGQAATQAGKDELRKWLRATTHRDDPVDYAVMLHWLWQVKRLNTGRPVAWDLMPILVGMQGGGKSTAIQILCRAWQELMIVIKAANLTDDRSTEILSDYAIGFWSEMSGGNKADAAALKSALTSVVAHYRELGGHNHNSVVRRMAFIGDSNSEVRDVIIDATGARRFYELKVPKATDQAALNALDPALIWQAISEDDPPPYDDVAGDVKERQRTLVHQDSFDHFLDWCDSESWARLVVRLDDLPAGGDGRFPTFEVPAYDPVRGYTLVEINVLFGHYCRLTKGVARGDVWLSRRLSENGWQKIRPRSDAGGKRPFYYLKPLTAADPIPAPTGPTRGEKAAAPPTSAEDLFAARQQPASERYVDEEIGPWPPTVDPNGGGDDMHL